MSDRSLTKKGSQVDELSLKDQKRLLSFTSALTSQFTVDEVSAGLRRLCTAEKVSRTKVIHENGEDSWEPGEPEPDFAIQKEGWKLVKEWFAMDFGYKVGKPPEQHLHAYKNLDAPDPDERKGRMLSSPAMMSVILEEMMADPEVRRKVKEKLALDSPVNETPA